MAKSELIARQSRLPTGWLGEIVARVMSLETIPANAAALDELEPSSYEAVLEVGCGHGRTLARIAASARAESDQPAELPLERTRLLWTYHSKPLGVGVRPRASASAPVGSTPGQLQSCVRRPE